MVKGLFLPLHPPCLFGEIRYVRFHVFTSAVTHMPGVSEQMSKIMWDFQPENCPLTRYWTFKWSLIDASKAGLKQCFVENQHTNCLGILCPLSFRTLSTVFIQIDAHVLIDAHSTSWARSWHTKIGEIDNFFHQKCMDWWWTVIIFAIILLAGDVFDVKIWVYHLVPTHVLLTPIGRLSEWIW